MILNRKNLKKLGACEAGIKFAERNFNEMDTEDFIVKGDFNRFYQWLEDALKYTYTYDEKGNMLSKTYPEGDTFTYEYDEKGRLAKIGGDANCEIEYKEK